MLVGWQIGWDFKLKCYHMNILVNRSLIILMWECHGPHGSLRNYLMIQVSIWQVHGLLLVKLVKKTFKLKPSKTQNFGVKRCVKNTIDGKHDVSFVRITTYCELLKETNPWSLVQRDLHNLKCCTYLLHWKRALLRMSHFYWIQ